MVYRKVGVPKNMFPKFITPHDSTYIYSECGGGLREIVSISVLSTVATVFAGLALLASSLAVVATVLFCKYRLEPYHFTSANKFHLNVARVNIANVPVGRVG